MSEVPLVLVTGGTGFISSWTIKQLLDEGYRVRATVRDPKSAKCKFLRDLPGASDRLELVPGDLLQAEGWSSAVSGCEYVHHIASPYSLTVKDPMKDLVEPAVHGTLNVLKACRDVSGVKRVILTSSVAAVSDCFDDWKTHGYGPNDWNTTSSLTRNPYYYSKTLAEKAAHAFMEKEKVGFTLSVINPFAVIGPSLDPQGAVNQSIEMINQMLQGKYPFNMPLALGIVDVRDVALAHVRAMQIDEAGGGKRFILWSGGMKQYEIAQVLYEECPEALRKRFKTTPPPKFLPKGLIVAFVKATDSKEVATFVSTNWKKYPRLDTRMATDILKIDFRNPEQSVRDTVRWLLATQKY